MNFQPLLEKARTWWENSDKTQKLISIVGALLLVALIGGTIFFATRQKMEPIFPGALPSEQGIVRDAVLGYGLPAEINSRGDVMVPVDKMPEIRMKLSQEGKIPSSAMSANGGPTVPAEGSFFQTPAEMEKKLMAQKEDELAKSIMTLTGIQSAIVHINFGKDSPFGDQKVAPSAIVNIIEKPGQTLTDGEGKAIARLVQNSIPGLEPQHVSVITNQGRMVYDGEEINSDDSVANRKLEAEREESKRREKELQKRLDLAFGPGTTLALLQVELNMDEVEIKEQREIPGEAPVARDSVTEELNGLSNRNVGAAGTDANVIGQPAAQPANGNTGNFKSETSSEKFPTSTSSTSTKKAAGQVESISVSVLVDQTKVQDLPAVQNFVNGVLSARGQRNFTATVVPTDFSTESRMEQQRLAADATQAQRIQQVISALPILVLIGIGLMLMKAISKSVAPPPAAPTLPALGSETATLTSGQLELPQPGGVQHLPGTTTVYHHTVEHELEESPLLTDKEPEYDLSQLDEIDLNSFSLSPEAEDGAADPDLVNGLKEILTKKSMEDEDPDISPIPIRDIREKVDVPLERIRKLAKERPETVATLLKTWVMEEH